MNDLINTYGSEILIGLFTLLGALIGVLIPTIFNHIKAKKDREDNYFFAMIEKRFEIYSEASYWCEILKHLIHKDDDEKYSQTQKAREWFSKNNLYLEPNIRQDFSNFILEVEMYKNKLEEWRITAQQEGRTADETQKKHNELKSTFNEIMVGIQNKIQYTIDTYYEIIKKKKSNNHDRRC